MFTKELFNYVWTLTVITPYLFERFAHSMDAPSVKRVTVRDNHFMLINSMALEGDGCFLCRPTELALRKMKSKKFFALTILNKFLMLFNKFFSGYLNCALHNKTKDACHDSPFKKYSRPILLQVSKNFLIFLRLNNGI